jgi:hypothetical protein
VDLYAQDDPTRGVRAHFMNLDIILDEASKGAFHTCKYDKWCDLPFEFSQYIQFNSNRPIKQAYSIAIS